MKIGLVLGAGGFVGGAWLTGALEALEDESGVLPTSFDNLVGTSAGSMIAALTGSGVHPSAVSDIFAGRAPRDGSEVAPKPAGATLRLQPGRPNPLPSSLKVAFNALRHRRTPVGVAFAAMMPRGFISTEPLRETVRQVVPSGWSAHPGLWLVSCEIGSGKRVALGRVGSPPVDLANAVAASCAIPGFYCPVSIEGREYVDGGTCSPSNLDILRDQHLDLVLCFNPTSSLHRAHTWNVTERIGSAYRSAAAVQLEREAATLRQGGAEVLTIQPTAEDLAMMGVNLMAANNLDAVSELARSTVRRQLREPGAAEFMRAVAARNDDLVVSRRARTHRVRRARTPAALRLPATGASTAA
ncbi:MAG: patatin-like phospholipase family protein [Candidatus Dormibacteria bacterium]